MLPESGVARAGAPPHVQDGGMQAARRPATRLFWLSVFAAALIALFAEVRAQPVPGDEAAVLAGDASLGEAMRNGDRAAARRLLSLQFTYADENGKVHERKAVLDGLKELAPTAGADVKVKLYGGVATVTGRRKTAQGSEAFFLDIWARQRGAWRVLTMQDVVLAAEDTPDASSGQPGDANKPACKNPCETIPYRVRSPVEQDVVSAFQAIEKAVVTHDADEWARHVADEFVLYGSGHSPLTKSDRVAAIERQKEMNVAVTPGEVDTMRLSVYGDGAAMIATHTVPNNARPPYRAARVWVRRNGQWQVAISVQTEIKNQ